MITDREYDRSLPLFFKDEPKYFDDDNHRHVVLLKNGELRLYNDLLSKAYVDFNEDSADALLAQSIEQKE